MTKEACLKFVQELEVVEHGESDCPYHDVITTNSLTEVDILRIRLSVPKVRDSDRPPENESHLGYNGPKCALSQHIHARKIVLQNTCVTHPIHLLDLPQTSLHTLVSLFSYDDLLPLGRRGHSEGYLRSNFLRRRPIRPSHAPDWLQKINTRCEKFVRGVVAQAMEVDSPYENIVVNIMGMARKRDHQSIYADDVIPCVKTSYWKQVLEDEITRLSADDVDLIQV
jgi:hypothetical protein